MQLTPAQLHRGAWLLVAAVMASCGGGGTAPTTPPDTKAYYSNPVGIGFADSPRKVELGQWPSWFAANQLVPGCASGEAFYLDECWTDLEINLDAGTVTFSIGAHKVSVVVGGALPVEMGVMKERAHGAMGQADQGWQDWAVLENTGPGYVRVTYNASALTIAGDAELWDDLPLTNGNLVRSRTGPWAVHPAIDTVNGLVSGLVVKTTVAFGMLDSADGSLWHCRVAHDWTPAGRLVVGGVRLALPTTLEAVAQAAGKPVVPASVSGGYEDTVNVSGTVAVRSEAPLLGRRAACGETDTSLLQKHLVTSVAWRSPLQ